MNLGLGHPYQGLAHSGQPHEGHSRFESVQCPQCQTSINMQGIKALTVIAKNQPCRWLSESANRNTEFVYWLTLQSRNLCSILGWLTTILDCPNCFVYLIIYTRVFFVEFSTLRM